MKVLDHRIILPSSPTLSCWYLPLARFKKIEQLICFIDTSIFGSFRNSKMLRNYNRPTLLALETLSESIREKITFCASNRVGIYTYVPRYEVIDIAMAIHGKGPIEETFKRNVPPKSVITDNTGLIAANLGIELKTTGPQISFFSNLTSFEAVREQIDFDLEIKRIDLALLVGVFSLEAYLSLNLGDLLQDNTKPLAESAVALLFERGNEESKASYIFPSKDLNYGHMQEVLNLCQGGSHV